jgi:cadmium resistance transport/sequestration family protein
MAETILAGIVSFVGTNIDDIFINTLFFAQADTKRKVKATIIGVYLGIGTLVLLSMLGAYFLQAVPQRYIGLLGFIPIILGIKAWAEYIQEKKNSNADESVENPGASKGLLWSVALVTIANGADNIGVYTPLFASYTYVQRMTIVMVFILMTALWCVLGKKLSDLPGLRNALLKHKHIMVPIVFIALGIYIILKANL